MKKLLLLSTFLFSSLIILAQGTWVQKANFGGTGRAFGFGFSIGTKGYLGTGDNTTGIHQSDMWEYDPGTNVWTQKASMNTGRGAPMSWVINGKGYVCMGYGPSGWLSDLWEYDPGTNNWTAKGNFPGAGRYGAAGFAIGNSGYINMGCPGGGNGPPSTDFWEYTPSTNAWAQKASSPMTPRRATVGLGIGSKGYTGFGYNGNSGPTYYNDWWCYDQATNIWQQKASYPGSVCAYPAVFVINYCAFAGTGSNGTSYFPDFYQYDPLTDTWTARANYPLLRQGVSGFAIGNKGYFGLGMDGTTYYNEFYEYTPQNVGVDELKGAINQCSFYPTVVSDFGTLQINCSDKLVKAKLNVYNVNGQLINTYDLSDRKFTLEKGKLSQGVYLFNVVNNDKKIGEGKFIIE